jgi:hypothetical protein
MSETPTSYNKMVFAFLDLLGFSSLVTQSERDPAVISRIHRLLERAKAMATIPRGQKFRVLKVDTAKFRSHVFSDSVTMSYPYDSFDSFNAIIAWTEAVQYLFLTDEGLPVRGGIAFGDVYDEGAIVFGPAMVAAYRLENEKARWPRVLVSTSMINQLSTGDKARAMKEHLQKSSPNAYYVDYLRDLFALVSADRERRLSAFADDPIELLARHKAAINLGAKRAKTNPNPKKRSEILLKYVSLSRYHNAIIRILTGVASTMKTRPKLIWNINSEVATAASNEIEQKRVWPEPQYSADNLKYVDILPVLGIANNRII